MGIEEQQEQAGTADPSSQRLEEVCQGLTRPPSNLFRREPQDRRHISGGKPVQVHHPQKATVVGGQAIESRFHLLMPEEQPHDLAFRDHGQPDAELGFAGEVVRVTGVAESQIERFPRGLLCHLTDLGK
jgi:hypothetical protein